MCIIDMLFFFAYSFSAAIFIIRYAKSTAALEASTIVLKETSATKAALTIAVTAIAYCGVEK